METNSNKQQQMAPNGNKRQQTATKGNKQQQTNGNKQHHDNWHFSPSIKEREIEMYDTFKNGE